MADQARTTAVDVAGIGFGPSNLALAVALSERGPDGAGYVFLERQQSFGWHRGMLIPGARMQVSFLKDLVSMRNPGSRYSFVSYLHARERLAEFINSKTLLPTRVEFHDYLEWAARDFESQVDYSTDALAVRPVTENGIVVALDVVARHGPIGETVVRRARDVVIGTGLASRLPEGVTRSHRVRHSCELLSLAADLEGTRPLRLVVVGAGQSAAEAVDHLHRTFPQAEVCAVFSRFGYSVADDSPFTNAIFDPDTVDVFHAAEQNVKEMLLGYHANTNYSVVDLALTEKLYRTRYDEMVDGRVRLRIMNMSRVREVVDGPGEVSLEIESLPTGQVTRLTADAVVFATGYRPSDPLALLGELAGECKRDSDDRILLERDHRVVTSGAVAAGIYLHGPAAEPSHGLSSGLLSTTAVRAGQIASSILRRKR